PDADLQPQIETLVGRVAPLLQAVEGWRGMFFNVGWLIDLVTEWTGDPSQPIPTLSSRTAKWAAHSYADLRDFVAAFRATAVHHELDDLKIGVLFVGWAHVVWPPELKIYDFDSSWYARHPELYAEPHTIIGMPDLHPINRLHADDYPYAAFPQGLSDGTYFPDFFGAQWASFAAFTGFDALLLRDGLTGPMVYTRNGPYGTSAPADPQLVAAFSDSVRDLYRAVKTADPGKLIFGYSSAISPIADWRVGCVDFEALVADGYIDGWIEQTWGGAWQDWWHQLWKGWTFQTANLLTRGAMIASANQQRDTPCRFYNLIETWDGWEPWDTLHQVPAKLRWAMWAFSHAAVVTPGGVHPPDGSYVSWVNNGAMDILSPEDVEYVGWHLDMAQASAARLEKVYGWTLSYSRGLLEWLSANHPDWNVSEWLDDQAALLMKWGVPILSATRAEWLAYVAPDALIAQPDAALSASGDHAPVLVTGRADRITSDVQAKLGIALRDSLIDADFHVARGSDAPPYDRPYLPSHHPIVIRDGSRALYRTASTPLITSRGSWTYWQPPDWSEPFNQFVPKYQLGSTFPHFAVARLLHQMARAAGLSHLDGIERSQPVAFHMWRSGGQVYVLLGNLETGEFGDSRTPRTVRLCLSRAQLELGAGDYRLARVDLPADDVPTVSSDEVWLNYTVTLSPESCAVYVVIP
ncbi:MAG: hypothetical protein IT319_21410, partial [Anaerolineae bacterium]|nr:hypothetical protein [Anaerolineae bacterium]